MMWGAKTPYVDTTGYGGAPIDPKQVMGRYLGGSDIMRHHGAPYGMSFHLPCFHRSPSIFRTNKRRLNSMAILINLIVPWLLFCAVFWLCSFSLRYSAPWTCWSLVALLFVLTVMPFTIAWWAGKLRREKQTEAEYTPMWYGFLAATCFLAVVAGILLGTVNMYSHSSKIYEVEHLATYKNINPASFVGEQMVDAGRITFNDKTHLDITKSVGFKDSDLYCVAPIVSNTTTKDSYLDFWAVGTNCCSGTQPDFHCAGYDDPKSVGGLRLLDEAARPFYRLAVQQAEATYKVKTHKPIFFVWGPDPIAYTETMKHASVTMFETGALGALCFQTFAVICATLVFAKAGPWRDNMDIHGP